MNIEKVIEEIRLRPEGIKGRELEFLSYNLRTAQHAVQYMSPVKNGSRFGGWRIALTKPHSIDWDYYEVILRECADEQGFAHWIAHLQQKVWSYDSLNFMLGVLTYQQKGVYAKPKGPITSNLQIVDGADIVCRKRADYLEPDEL
jgi:hypothetical protein